MFEAVHGSAPDIGREKILLILLSSQCCSNDASSGNDRCFNRECLEKTIEDGIHTADIYNKKTLSKKVGTKEFANEVIKRLGQKPTKLTIVNYADAKTSNSTERIYSINTKEVKTLWEWIYLFT